ncbi:NYN domain-containing protein [Synechococcales cyanobacterium C]|uniref:NYN domain-containing protein n=1 Tax=Petrachloros mirabilis ULC683 TaxID=2781853 RepID=A0A8K2A0W3_9CYAN|nr:NYN domain-containing protein [Petrachloros mirabilis]NCJ07737.1 NYN domain-containing protein [Petrachloros mirabilis ULC683]
MAAPAQSITLLVDGYNIIGAWTHLKRLRDRHGLEAARNHLIEVLSNYSAFQGYQTHLVFDAHYQKTIGHGEVITETLQVYYTPFGQTADTHIEIFCARTRKMALDQSYRVIVATSDRAQTLTVIGYGAEWMSAHKLWAETELVTTRIQRQKARRQKRSGGLLHHALDPAAQQRLEQLRRGVQ